MREGTVRIETSVEAIAEVEAWLAAPFTLAARTAADEALVETLDEAVVDAKAGAPVDTGAHRQSIRRERYANPRGFATYQGIRAGGYVRNPKTGRIVDYSRHLEYGTSRMRPRPHIRPALRNSLKKYNNRFYARLGRYVKLE
jgi:HK97 gp10 family phage protein